MPKAFGLSDSRVTFPIAQVWNHCYWCRPCSNPLQILDSADIPSSSHEQSYPSCSTNSSRKPTEPESSNNPHHSDSDMVMPSLVTRLQKMHGLTKKKIYGAKPKREPFVREDRIRDKDHRMPPTLSISLNVPSALPPTPDAKSPSAESRMPLKAKSERSRRLSANGPFTVNPPESGGSSSGRRSPRFRRGSRSVLSADSGSGSYPSSPTSASSFSANSPVLPTPRDIESLGNGTGIGVAVAAPWEPSWPQNHTEYILPSLHQYGNSATYSTRSASGNAIYSPHLNGPATPTPFSGPRDNLSVPGLTSAEGSKATESVGDQPFILSPEYEAAVTARFQAIFQSSNYKSEIQGLSSPVSYIEPSANLPSSTLDSNAMSFSTTMGNFSYGQAQDSPFTQSQFSTQTREVHSNVEPALGASSLEGWDGRSPL